MQKLKIISVLVSLLFLTACGNGASTGGAGANSAIKLAQHQAVGTWKDTFDNTVITLSSDGSYTIKELGFGASEGSWTVTGPNSFMMPTSKSYDQEGRVISSNRVEFSTEIINNTTGNRVLSWVRM